MYDGKEGKREVIWRWALGHGYMEACPVLLGEVCEGSAFHNPSQIQLAGNVFKPSRRINAVRRDSSLPSCASIVPLSL